MKGEERETNLDWYCRGDIILRTEIEGLDVEIHTYGTHEIRLPSKN
jgi:hypothetical protein